MESIKSIISDWLISNGYDGLCNPEAECGCRLDDLMCCKSPYEDNCVCAYLVPNLDFDGNGLGEWILAADYRK